MTTKSIGGLSVVFSCLFLFFTATASAGGLQKLSGHVPAAIKALKPAGLLAATNHLNLAISLPLRNTAELSKLLQDIYDPASPEYHHYLTPEEFAKRFGPTEADYQGVIAFAKANGLRVTATYPNRVLLDVSGPVANVESALHVTLRTYRHPTENRTFYAPDTEPSLDLAVPILHVSGLDNYSLPRPRLMATPLAQDQKAKSNAGSGPGGTYMGNDFHAAYAPGVTLNGSGQSVGLLEFDGYTASDITYYESEAGLPNVTLQNVLVDGASGLPSGSGGEVEVSLDIEMAISMATNLSEEIVYMAPNVSPFVDLLNRMATDNLAKQLSCSWYISGGTEEPAADLIFEQMAAQGQSFFSASGDSDAYTGLIPFPGDTPYVTEVGGTTLTMSGAGGGWSSETVWNWGTEYGQNGTGSSGGISTQYPIPSWQTNISMTGNQGSTTMRNTPDVAMTADNVFVRADQSDYSVGGTSCAAPLWAGFAALVNQQAASSGQPMIGFVNPALDAIGTGANYSSAFHDITTGNNTWSSSPTKFYAVAGYDLCTGWGTPAGQSLINALANPEALLIKPATGFTATGGTGGPFTITFESFSLTNAGTNSLTWTLANTSVWLNVSSGGGTLLSGGPAAIVTVSLNAAASNLVVGIYSATINFTNLNDGSAQGRQFTLNVIAPPTITMQPTNQAVLGGATAVFSVSATGGLPLAYQWQYNSNNLTDGGNISGSATTNLVITDVSTSNVGTYTVVVTNLAGSVTSSNALLTLIPSPPVIILQPTNEEAVVGETVTFFVGVIGTTPFSYQWSFDTTNIVGATNGTLTLTDVQLTNTGNYSVLVTNIYGSTNSAIATLTVTPCDPAPSGLVSWWPAEGNANDIIGTNNGIGSNISYTIGEVGEAFELNGSNAYVRVPASESLNVGAGTGFTIEGWISPADITQQRPIAEWNSGSGYGAIFWISVPSPYGSGSGCLYGALPVSGNNHIFCSAAGLIISNEWQHVAMTYDQSSGVGTLYLNGVVVTQQTLGNLTPLTTYDLYLGYRPPEGDVAHYWIGAMDEMSLYSRALSSNEVSAIYNAGGLGKCPVPPYIEVQPANQIVAVGSNAMFNVIASGTAPLFYQWSFNGTNLVGATNTSLILNDVQFAQAGMYAVTVSNVAGFIISSNATLTVGYAPSITTQPVNQTNLAGTTAAFTVAAMGSTPLYYQWQYNGTNLTDGGNISGSTTTNLVITSVSLANGGIYTVVVSNVFGSTLSSNALLTVLSPPIIILQPTNEEALVGETVTFSVGVIGTTPFSYQWSFDTTNIVGATNATLTLTDVQLTNTGNYSVLVTNLYGFTNSATATLTVNMPPACDLVPTNLVSWWPGEGNAYDIAGTNNGITTNISYAIGEVGQAFELDGSNAYVRVPASASLNVGEGSGLTVECWINPADITQARPIVEWNSGSGYGAQLWISEASPYGNGPGCLVGAFPVSGNNHVFSSAAGLITTNEWQHVALTYDQSSGVGTLYLNGAVIAQQNLGNLTPQTTYDLYFGYRPPEGAAAVYWLGAMDEVSLYSRALSSNEVAAIYNAGVAGKCFASIPPVITTQPVSQTNFIGTTASFSVTASGTLPLNYQWSFNATNIVGATNATLTLSDVQFTNAGDYSVLVTNFYGFTNSATVTLTVNPPPPCDLSPTNLVSWWSAEGNAYDMAGTNNGITTNITYTSGEVGQAFNFNGSNAYVRVPASASLNVGAGSGFTVECWINPEDITQQRPIVEWNSTSGYGALLWISVPTPYGNGPGCLYGALPLSGNNHIFCSAAGLIVSNEWQHVAMTYNQSSGVGTLYLNGVIVTQQTLGSLTPQTTYNLSFGYRPPEGAPAVYWLGDLDEVSLYSRALSSNEIAAIYSAGSNGKCPLPPTILVQPTNYTVLAGNTAMFSVVANGSAPLSYQWSFNTTNLVGATNATLALTNVQLAQAGAYAVQVANTAGSVTSSNAVLTVNSAPIITVQPASQTNFVGTTATFNVTAIGSSPLRYQWNFGGTNIFAATNTVLTLTNVQFSQAGNYAVRMTNIYGSILSSNAALVVNSLFHFVWNPIPTPRFANTPFAVTVEAQNPTNGLATNFNTTVMLLTTNGEIVYPSVSGNFIQGLWTGAVSMVQTGTNLVLEASDIYGETGLANPISVVNLPPLATAPSGSTLYIFWPVDPSGFVLETSPDLLPGTWVPVGAPPVMIGNQYLQPVQMSGTNAFYRLHFTGQ